MSQHLPHTRWGRRRTILAGSMLASFMLVCIVFVAGAGLSTHFHAADLATARVDASAYPRLYGIIREKWPDAVRTGAIFPDWGWAMPGSESAAERAHGEDFYHNALELLHEKYPAAWGPHEEKLFAFICGIASHVVFDDAWHYGDTAFLTMAHEKDVRSGRDAHMTIEMFVDIFVQVEHRPGREERGWFIPADDMAEVYHRLGRTDVTASQITAGYRLLYVAVFAEDLLGWILYLPARLVMPWTHDHYMSWWDGGVEDGAERGALAIQLLWDEWEMLSNAQVRGPAPRPAHRHHDHESRHRHPSTDKLSLARDLLSEGLLQVRVETLRHGAVCLGPIEIRDWPALVQRLIRAHEADKPLTAAWDGEFGHGDRPPMR